MSTHKPSKRPARDALESTKKSTGSRIWKLLGSPKLTLFVGVLTFGSILYYKNNLRIQKQKDAKHQIKSKKKVPLLALKQSLGQTRPGGPHLTMRYFRRGELLIRKKGKHYEWALIDKRGDELLIFQPNGKQASLLPWLKETGGRFALYRTSLHKKLDNKQVQQALQAQGFPFGTTKVLASKTTLQALQTLLNTYKLALPTPAKNKDEQHWLAHIVEESHYNDLDPELHSRPTKKKELRFKGARHER